MGAAWGGRTRGWRGQAVNGGFSRACSRAFKRAWHGAFVGAGCTLLLWAAAGLPMAAAQAAEAGPPQRTHAASDTDDDGMARVIVQYRAGSPLATASGGVPRLAQTLGKQLGLTLQDRHVLGERTQSLRASGIGSAALAARLAARSDVEWAVPVRRKYTTAALPNDPYFAGNQTTITPAAGQWYLRAPDSTTVSAINALGAWALTEGSPSITVAVLDTGVRLDHPDLASKLRAGYDFVSRTSSSVDGNGVDADPSDPGDYSSGSDSCGASDSSWHGTQTAGLVGAATNNGIGIAGAGRNIMVQPVRVLGKCGGYDDDIQAGMRWAGGLANSASCTSSSGVSSTCNPTPAKVLNMSLGASGSCSTAYKSVIAQLNAAGVTVVVAAGNDSGHAVSEPANCDGALAVAGLRHSGTKVGYSNLGPQVTVSAPAGNCVNESGLCLYPLMTTTNSGTSTPGSNTYSGGASAAGASLGTSFAAPLVAGTVGLMLSVNSALTPAQVKALLQSSARSFPTSGAQTTGASSCQAPSNADQIECYCTTSTCGAGMLDAQSAVTQAQGQVAVAAPTAVITASAASVTAGGTVALSASGSTANGTRSITSTLWEITSGASLARFSSATNSASATLATSAAGTVTVKLTVTDSAGATGSRSQTITINAVGPPTAAISASATTVNTGNAVTLDGSASAANGNRSIASYQWAITSGAGLASFSGATNAATVSLQAASAGTVTVQLTVTDSAGATGTASQTITISASQVVVSAATSGSSSGTGGGALDAGWLFGLLLALGLLKPASGQAQGSAQGWAQGRSPIRSSSQPPAAGRAPD